MSLYKRGGVWWLDIAPPGGGERIRRSTRASDRAAAQRIHDEFRAELWKRRRRGGTFHGALKAWQSKLPKGNPDRYRVGKLLALPDRSIDDVTGEWLASVLPASSPGTFNRYANLVCAALAKAGHPAKIVRQRPPRGRLRWLTSEEWEALRRALPAHQRPMAELAIATGIRQANVFRLEWSQVDLSRRIAWIHPDQAKAGKPIRVPLNDDAMRVLLEQQKAREAREAGREWVFVGKGGKMPPTEIKTAWATACKAAGVEGFTWHGLRHTWATWHVMAGTPLEVLKELGGWADLRMVLRYSHLATSHIDRFAGNAKPWGAKKVA